MIRRSATAPRARTGDAGGHPIRVASRLTGIPVEPPRRVPIRARSASSPRRHRTALRAVVWVLASLVLVLGIGCEASPGAGEDAGAVDASAVDAAFAPTPPAEPDAPMLEPCPDGWGRGVHAGDPSSCEPWGAASSPPACDAPGSASFVGEGCRRVGSACPSGAFATADLPAGAALLYVDPSAAIGGDGSEASPFARIAEAMGRASPGTVILLAAGTYPEAIWLRAGVTVRGACAARTVIAPSPAARDPAAIVAHASGATLRDVTVAPEGLQGALVDGELTLDGVIVEAAQAAGVFVPGGALVARDVVVTGTQAEPASGALGRGIAVEGGGRAEIERAVLSNNGDAAVLAAGGAHVVIDRAAIRETRATVGDPSGIGLAAFDGGDIVGSRVEIARSEDVGIYCASGGHVALSDAVVRDTLDVRARAGFAVGVRDGAIELRRVVLERARRTGVYLQTNVTALLEDVLVRDTQPVEATGALGVALAAGPGSRVSLARALFVRNRGAGVIASGDVEVALGDVRIDDTGASSEGGSVGLVVASGARASGARIAVARSEGIGIDVRGEGTSLVVSDVGLASIEAAPSEATGYGRALEVGAGAHVALTRLRAVEAREVAILAAGAGTELSLADALVAEPRRRACADSSCMGAPGGIGVGAYAGATVTLERFVVERAPLCGVQLSGGASLDMREGAVARSAIGACVQDDGYDLERLSRDVVYVDNGINVSLTSLPVPDVTHASAP